MLRIGDAQDHISESAVEGSSVRKIPAGSLLMVVRGMILARAFPVAISARQVTINQDMKALIPIEPETAEFLLMVLRASEPQVLATIERSTHGTCKLQTEILEAFMIPFPPLAEQRRIVAKVDETPSAIDFRMRCAKSARGGIIQSIISLASPPRHLPAATSPAATRVEGDPPRSRDHPPSRDDERWIPLRFALLFARRVAFTTCKAVKKTERCDEDGATRATCSTNPTWP
jgi:Type I restriction modification DNA specificity domain